MGIPGPETGWERADVEPMPGAARANPAVQFSLWESSRGSYAMLAQFRCPVAAIARRLRLTLENSWDALGDVELAYFQLKGAGDFVISQTSGQPGSTLWWSPEPDPGQIDRAYEGAMTAIAPDPEIIDWKYA